MQRAPRSRSQISSQGRFQFRRVCDGLQKTPIRDLSNNPYRCIGPIQSALYQLGTKKSAFFSPFVCRCANKKKVALSPPRNAIPKETGDMTICCTAPAVIGCYATLFSIVFDGPRGIDATLLKFTGAQTMAVLLFASTLSSPLLLSPCLKHELRTISGVGFNRPFRLTPGFRWRDNPALPRRFLT